jgi:hypothetical protein
MGELVHMDLAGPMETTSFDTREYFLIIVNDYSHGIWVEALTLKSEAVSKICDFVHLFETGYGVKVRGFMADNGTEFVNSDMQQFIKEKRYYLVHVCPIYSQAKWSHRVSNPHNYGGGASDVICV